MAGGTRHRALDAFLHRLRTRAATALLRLFPAWKKRRLGQAAEGFVAGKAYRQVRAAPRERMAAQADTMDKALSRPVGDDADDQKAIGCRTAEICGDERRLNLSYAAACQRNRDHGTIRAETVCFFLDLRRGFFYRAARVHRRSQGNRIPRCDRPAHADRTRLAACLASQARQEVVEAIPALSHPR